MAAALVGVLTIAGAAGAADRRGPGATPGSSSSAGPSAEHKAGQRVHEAWPQKEDGRKPSTRLGRKLARQVGPIRISKRNQRASATAPRASARRGTSVGGAPGVVEVGAAEEGRLLLVRSFDIPKDDPLYADLANYSWTYDNALAALAFVGDGNRSLARELLDQLAALQNKDGSIDFAFDVRSGGSSPVVRSGAIAWVGLAAAAYRQRFGDRTYDPMIAGLVHYLLRLRGDDGLVAGGPDVTWASTQHNLLTAELLRELREQGGEFGRYGPDRIGDAEASLDAAIDKQLLVDDGDQVHFKEGFEDDRIPVDVQALGAMYLQTRGDERAKQVADFIQQKGFFISADTRTPERAQVSGLRPFLDPEAPYVIWTEGTLESQFSLARLGIENAGIAEAVKSLAATMDGEAVGPIGADRESVSSWGEYRTWPTSAATSWLLMLKSGKEITLFAN